MSARRQDAVHRFILGAVVAASQVLSGCVTTDSLFHKVETPPTGTPAKLVSTWNKEVAISSDPTRNGAPVQGIVGRVYTFGADEKFPVIVEGTLVVDLFDDTPVAEGKNPVQLEEWQYDKDTLRRLARRDTFGWGYTLFLPWSTYKPTITQVHLQVRFVPTKSAPLNNVSTIVIGHTNTSSTSTTTVVGKPSAPKPSAANPPSGSARAQ